MARIEKLLAQCLDDMEAGNSVEEILDQYPQQREELEPLLHIAQRLHFVPQVTPSPTFRRAARTRMLNAIQARASAENHQVPLRTRNSLFSHVWLRRGGGAAGATPLPVFRFATAATLTLVLLVVGGLLLRSWLGVIVTRTATLADVSGVVKVLPADHDTWQTAKTGTQIAPGDRIRTGTSDATLVFFDGSTTNMAAQTELTVFQLSSRRDGHGRVIALYQQAGRTYNHVQRLPDPASRFEIETPSATATVHGTVFIVEVMSGDATQVAVGEGSVEVTAQEETIIVSSGEATIVQPGLPPAPSIPAPTPSPPATTRPTEPSVSGDTPEPTETPSLTEAPQPAKLPTNTPHLTETPTHNTPQPTWTPTPTPMPLSAWTPTPTPSPTRTPTPTSSPARVPARTPRPTWTPTNTPRPAWTPTNTPRPTWTPTNTPRPTWTPTRTPIPTNTPTRTPIPTNTPTNTPRPTNTPTRTPTPTNTPTNTPHPTNTPTNTPIPTNTPTNTPRPTNTPTNTPIPTNTPTNTPIPTNTPTNTPIPTDTPDPTKTPQLP